VIHFFADDNYISAKIPWVVEFGDKQWKYEMDEEYFVYGGLAVTASSRREVEESFASIKATHGLPHTCRSSGTSEIQGSWSTTRGTGPSSCTRRPWRRWT
jgi:hypothetical protein